MQTSIVLNINRDYEMAQIWVNQGPITRAHERQLLYRIKLWKVITSPVETLVRKTWRPTPNSAH